MDKKKLLQIGLTVAILALILAKVGPAALLTVLQQAGSPYLLLAVIFFVLQTLLLSLRWQKIVSDGKLNLGYDEALKMTTASNLANALLFTSLSGILVRIGMVMKKGVPMIKATYLAIADRILTLAALLLLGVAFLPFALDYLSPLMVKLFIAFAGTVIFMLPFVLWWMTANINRQIVRRNRQVFRALAHLRRLFWRRKGNGIIIIASSFAAQLCFFVAVYFLILTNGGTVAVLPLLAIVPVISIISAFPVGVGGWGLREGAFVFGLHLLSLPAEIALATSIEVGILTIVTAVFMYLVTFGTGRGLAQLQRWQQDAKHPR